MPDQTADKLIIETEIIEAETPPCGPERGFALAMVLGSIIWCVAGSCLWHWLT